MSLDLFTKEEFRFTSPEFLISGDYQICGVDEAGRGPLAGPLSLGLVSFDKNTLLKILKSELLKDLNDSKKVTESKRNLLLTEIKASASISAHQFVSNTYIDNFGISKAIFYGIKKLIIKAKLGKPFLLIDGNYNFKKIQEEEHFFFDYKSIIKGDSTVASIAAASIIAKVIRDEYMEKIASQYPEYGFEKHKGYGTEAHLKMIQKYGYSKIHRKSFKIKKAEENGL